MAAPPLTGRNQACTDQKCKNGAIQWSDNKSLKIFPGMCKIDERRRTEGFVAIDSLLRDDKKKLEMGRGPSEPSPLQMKRLL